MSLDARLAIAGLLAAAAASCADVSGESGAGSATCSADTAGESDVDRSDGGAPVSPCTPPDSDGLTGGCYAFDVTVDDTGFSTPILKTENAARVTLTLTNAGTTPHDFVIECMPIDAPGCAPTVCFPGAANLAPLPPGGQVTTSFVTPYVEGIYLFRSDVGGDSQVASDGGAGGIAGQFVVQ